MRENCPKESVLVLGVRSMMSHLAGDHGRLRGEGDFSVQALKDG